MGENSDEIWQKRALAWAHRYAVLEQRIAVALAALKSNDPAAAVRALENRQDLVKLATTQAGAQRAVASKSPPSGGVPGRKPELIR